MTRANRGPWVRRLWLLAAGLVVVACVSGRQVSGTLHRWWAGLGPVLPHESFPADCSLCHVGDRWNILVSSFRFDHAKETGVPLEGAHAEALCLRCHNDRGPVAQFQARGCGGCHEDVHQGFLGTRCTECHQQETWRAVGMIEKHEQTRFPLIGSHLGVSCVRCHPGALVGRYVPIDARCSTCHQRDLQNAVNPPHLGLGWTDHCERCHTPTKWEHGSVR
ncbi:MAG: hypothetical protein R3F30_03645 [Planctomycetota bacterium]